MNHLKIISIRTVTYFKGILQTLEVLAPYQRQNYLTTILNLFHYYIFQFDQSIQKLFHLLYCFSND